MALSCSDTVLSTVRTVRELVASDAVTGHWAAGSACEGMSVGGLTHHLASQASILVRLLGEERGAAGPVTLLHHYRNAPWANSGLDDEVNVSIREGSDRAAAAGPAEVLAGLERDLAALPPLLAAVTDDDPVLIPWQGWALTAHDLVVTRLMEMVVHSDDLAASVALPTPEFPADAQRLVVGLLAEVAADRHGQAAVVRTLSRPQRAPASVSAF